MDKLVRTTFETSRELEFFSEKELQMQIGHGRELWPAALLKELIDNSLDACEAVNVPPQVEVVIAEDTFSVRDNGPGLPKKTIKQSLDYLKRVSDKTFYVSPTRGQLGNALKVVWAAPFVAHGDGLVEVWSQGLHHTIELTIDRIAQRPAVNYIAEKDGFVKNGTFVKMHWPDLACSTETEDEDFYKTVDFRTMARELIEGYAAFNPHAVFRLGDVTFEATDPDWKKWRPDEPTSPHWYTRETLRDLIAAYIAQEMDGGRARTVRELVSEFRGLSGTAKQKAATGGELSGVYLHDLVNNGDIDMGRVEKLLEDMKNLSKPPKPTVLGIIGQDHLKKWMVRYASVAEGSFKYIKRVGVDGLPHVLEVGFGIRDEGERRIVSGLNFAPTLVLPAEEMSSLLAHMRIDRHDPVTVVVHIARPRFDFVDRGKTRLEL